MGTYFSDFVPRLRRYPIVAIAGVCALVAHAAAPPVQHNTVQLASNFEEQRGQTSERYLWRNSGTQVSLGAGGRVSVIGSAGAAASLSFVGASRQSQARGEVPSLSKTIYYLGASDAGRTASNFERVRYAGIYPGIDVVFVSIGGRLEYNFELAPHADPAAIRIRDERSSLHLTRGGDLEARAGDTIVTERHPIAFQSVQGRTRRIACDYRLIGSHQAGLRLGAYDPAKPLFIDPVVTFSTYVGGPGYDSINAAATDALGNLYVAGETGSGLVNSPSAGTRSSRDAFIAKFDSAGNQVFAMYLGGSDYDSARGIVLDPLGNIYVTGVTSSSNFPVTGGALQTQAPGGGDAFVAKLNASFVLQYATYLGGGSPDFGLAIAVDSTGAAYVTGQTESTAFPVTTGAFAKSYQGGVSDCFIAKLNPAGSALAYSTYLGGNALDLCAGIALDGSGNAYVAGSTNSDVFPVLAPLQSMLLGSTNAFVAKLNAAGSALLYSTYLGGGNIDNATAIAVDATGAAYVTGDTSSINFPTTLGVVQNTLKGRYNAFVSKLSAPGNGLIYSTLIGGSDSDVGSSIAIDPAGRAIIGGYTTSFDFPTFNSIQTFQGLFDAFSTVLDPNGVSLVFSSYFGGADDDRGYAVAAAPVNKLFLAGITSSSNFPVAAPTQAALSVAPDAFVVGVAYIAAAGVPAANSVTPSSGSGTTQTFTVQYSDTAGTGSLQQMWVYFNATLDTPAIHSCQLNYNISTNQLNLLNDAGVAGPATTLGTAVMLQNSQCGVNVAATTVALNGNTLTLNVPMTFLPSFAGAKNIYLSASDVSGANSGWQQLGAWTVPGAVSIPTVIAVTPSSGTGASQTFALLYADSAGGASLQQVWVYFNSTLASPATNSCQLYYNAPLNQIDLINDAGAAGPPATLGSAVTLQNSQCLLNVGAATVSVSGNTLTLNVAVTFLASFGGAKNIYMYATDAQGSNSGWQPRGTWTVPGSVGPAAVSVTPSSGSGASQTFALQYSDSAGAASLQQVGMWFNTTLASSAANSCSLYYNIAANQLNLLNDGATAATVAAPGAATTLHNSQCSLNMAATTAVRSGNTLTLNLAMTFQTAYAGVKNIYMYALDVSGANSGWQKLGAWTVPGGAVVGTPATVLVAPSSGSGSSQTFTLQYSDTAGASSLQQVGVWFNATLANSAANSCSLYYNVAANQLNLLNDGATAATVAAPGAATTLHNSQCSLNMAATTAVASGNTLTLNLAMTFQTAYAGAKKIYMYAIDVAGPNSGWQQRGSWTVQSLAGTPSVVSTTLPSSAPGGFQTLALQYSDTAGASSLQQLGVWFNATLANSAANSCTLYYNVAVNQINLLNNGATAAMTAAPGAATTLQNSQCSLNVAETTVTKSGDMLTLNLAMAFQPAYAGPKNIYTYAIDVSGSNTGWRQLGTWTVAGTVGTPATVSVTPSSGSGASQSFALQFSDTAGASSLQQVGIWFNATLANSAANSCTLYYNVAANQINLLNDGATAAMSAAPGGATTLQNSQCSLSLADTTVTISGDTLTLNLAITFQPAYAGSKSIYTYAIDVSGANSGWVQPGTWTVE